MWLPGVTQPQPGLLLESHQQWWGLPDLEREWGSGSSLALHPTTWVTLARSPTPGQFPPQEHVEAVQAPYAPSGFDSIPSPVGGHLTLAASGTSSTCQRALGLCLCLECPVPWGSSDLGLLALRGASNPQCSHFPKVGV